MSASRPEEKFPWGGAANDQVLPGHLDILQANFIDIRSSADVLHEKQMSGVVCNPTGAVIEPNSRYNRNLDHSEYAN
jgi:hypothetical protein